MQASPLTQVMKISDVKQQFSDLVNRVSRRETRVLVEKGGIPVAGIVSVQDLKRLDRLDREKAERFKALHEFAAGFSDQTPDEIERETTRAIAEVRAEQQGKAAAAR